MKSSAHVCCMLKTSISKMKENIIQKVKLEFKLVGRILEDKSKFSTEIAKMKEKLGQVYFTILFIGVHRDQF